MHPTSGPNLPEFPVPSCVTQTQTWLPTFDHNAPRAVASIHSGTVTEQLLHELPESKSVKLTAHLFITGWTYTGGRVVSQLNHNHNHVQATTTAACPRRITCPLPNSRPRAPWLLPTSATRRHHQHRRRGHPAASKQWSPSCNAGPTCAPSHLLPQSQRERKRVKGGRRRWRKQKEID